MRPDITYCLVVSPSGLQRCMRSPMRQVEKKGPVFVVANDLNAFVGPVVCQIAARLKHVAGRRIKTCRITHRRPKETINGVKIELRIDHIWMVFRKVKTTGHEQAVVEALGIGPHAIFSSQVPLADVRRVIVTVAEHLGNG